MEEFSLRDVCNSVVLELSEDNGDKNIIRKWIDPSVPDRYHGQSKELSHPIKKLSSLMALKLVNGMISLELREWSKKGNEVSLNVSITGSGIADPKISGQRETKEQLVSECQALSLGSSVAVSFLNEKLSAKFSITLRMGGKNDSPPLIFQDKRILIVEDNEVNALVFSRFLEDWGIQVELAHSGEEGVEMACTNDYHAVIMDLYMPGLSGVETIKKIREFNDKVPIVALSASRLRHDMESAFEAGINEYLYKPISKDDLLNSISKLL
jgi:CheY-like chemotaxis protein